MQIEIDKITIDFECLKCETTEKDVPITEVIETGSPVCVDCNEEMEYVCAHMEEMEGRSG